MERNPNIPTPSDQLIRWAMSNPSAVQQAIELLQRLQGMRVDIVPPGGNNRFPLTPIDSPSGMVLALPLQLPVPYAAPTGTLSRATFATSTVTTAQLAQRVAALITDLRATGQAPSA